jgi:hypothetical protein
MTRIKFVICSVIADLPAEGYLSGFEDVLSVYEPIHEWLQAIPKAAVDRRMTAQRRELDESPELKPPIHWLGLQGLFVQANDPCFFESSLHPPIDIDARECIFVNIHRQEDTPT